MLDTESSADVFFYDTFKRMGYTKSLLKEELTKIVDFTGETAYSLRSSILAVTAGDFRRIIRFIVTDRSASFGAILSRPWIYSMNDVPLTYYQCLKFPSPEGIKTICGSQKS